MIILVCAVNQESTVIRRHMTARAGLYQNENDTGRLWQGRLAGFPVLLLQTGMGKENACIGLDTVLKAYPTSCVLNFGFSAAAEAQPTVGDLVLSESFQTTDKTREGCILHADPGLIQAAKQAYQDMQSIPGYPDLYVGGCLMVDGLVSDPQEKQRLGQQYAVQVIDMESYALADVAADRNIPFLALRAISDDMNEALPSFSLYVRPDGKIHWPSAITRWIAHPNDMLRLLGMARHIRRAQNSLSEWLPGVISRISV